MQVEHLRRLTDEWEAKEYEQNLCILLDPVLLKFALLVVSLRQAMRDYRQYSTVEAIQALIQQICENPDEVKGLRRLLSQIGWLWPVSVVFQVDFRPEAGENAKPRKNVVCSKHCTRWPVRL